MSLSILIPTVHNRPQQFVELYLELMRQLPPREVFDWEVHICSDPKIVTIGEKRNDLLGRATKTHLVFIDDDDALYPNYIEDIIEALKNNPDCIGCVIDMTVDGTPHFQCVHSLRFKEWSKGPVRNEEFGTTIYERGVTHRNPLRTSIAQSVRFPDIRFGEDHVWSDAVTKLCKTEAFMPRPSFIYRYSTKEKHNEKYGIR